MLKDICHLPLVKVPSVRECPRMRERAVFFQELFMFSLDAGMNGRISEAGALHIIEKKMVIYKICRNVGGREKRNRKEGESYTHSGPWFISLSENPN